MTVFKQLGDPVCPDCLCQHHKAAYAERNLTETGPTMAVRKITIRDEATVIRQTITIIERCCVVVNVATATSRASQETEFEIERPIGKVRTTQGDHINSNNLTLLHHATWEVLDPGIYTYYLVNRAGFTKDIYATWIKIIASDCEA